MFTYRVLQPTKAHVIMVREMTKWRIVSIITERKMVSVVKTDLK